MAEGRGEFGEPKAKVRKLEVIQGPTTSNEKDKSHGRNDESPSSITIKVLDKSNVETPPDDFRDIDIFPSENDIHSTIEPFIRKNKIRGSYVDLDHYLDVQFRLLREDFIGPLRQGIHQYVKSTKQRRRKRNQQTYIRIYENVRVVSPICLPEGLRYKIQFDSVSLRKINWRKSKRLIYGSLLCLTTDDFKTFLIATVADRNIEEVKHGYIEVRFEGNTAPLIARELFSRIFTMAETTGYFESYRHVLTDLQNLQQGDLPFQEYLLDCGRNIKPPCYLDDYTYYDFSPLIRKKRLSQIESRITCNVLALDTWPTAQQLHLDESQYNALQSALTKEFALIQGPPGTGKTYIGLQIAKMLLHNKRRINGMLNRQKPILVVCYTNHALDQFLEGIVKFHKTRVIRVGGQSKSDILKEFSLKKNKNIYRRQGKLERRFYNETIDNVLSIYKISVNIDVYHSHVLKLEFLRPYMDKKIYQMLSTDIQKPTSGNNPENFPLSRWLQVNTILERSELEELSSGVDPEIQDRVIVTNSQRLFDKDEEEFEQYMLKCRKHIVQTVRKYEAETFFEDKIAPEEMNERDWQRLKALNMRNNAAIRHEICSQDIMKDADEQVVKDPLELSLKNRWKLYRLWVRRACQNLHEVIISLKDSYREKVARYKEDQIEDDFIVMKEADVIGMTTTCAARYFTILQKIEPNIVIMEEAAEVFEAHIVTALSRGCEHLILIGDHKQLRPNPSVYELATKFNFDVSLFERMILNGVNFNSLELQHRMRPEISVLMRHIYGNLKNHDSVKKYKNVKGVLKNMFMINHGHHEDCSGDGTSHSNRFEAKYASALCKYLLQQGYKSSQITILAPYISQMHLLRRNMQKDEFEGVKITVVDNYQGEENDIVILSLVRSNEAGSVGFLKTENRICVALSRAKVGFYVIGNFTLLKSQSEIWKKIADDMKIADQIGDGLPLYCQNHPYQDRFFAKTPNDFINAPGCKKLCESPLPCGHSCKKYCHLKDKEHHHCKEPCNIRLTCGHTCQNYCGSSHTTHCKTVVFKTFPCGHSSKIQCGSFKTAKCTRKCENKCVHRHCDKLCWEPCTPCMKKCVWQCKHKTCSRRCSEPCDREPCNKLCKKKLDCGHPCIGLCGEPCPILCRHCDKDVVTINLYGKEDNPKACFIMLQNCNHIVESKALDKYMKSNVTEGNAIVQLKGCPICDKPIRNSYRYGRLVNQTLSDIEKVKQAAIGDDQVTGNF